MTSKSKRKENMKRVANDVRTGIKDIVKRGNQRFVVIKSREGRTLYHSSLTIAALALFILLMLPGTILIVGFMVLVGIIMKVKIEIQRIISESEHVVEVEIGKDS